MSEQTGNLNLTGVNDHIRAQRLAQLNLLLSRNPPIRIPIKRLDDHIFVDTMIYLTIPDLSWTNKTLYITGREDNEDGTAVLTAVERTASMFTWDYTQTQDVDAITSEPIFILREELEG